MKTLTVTVAGAPGSGKSVIAQIIRSALKEKGFTVTGDFELRCSEDLARAIDPIREMSTVNISEQTRRG